MEIVSVKFQEDVLKEIDRKIAKHNFNSRTEFIRESVREKIAGLTREEIINEFMKLKGKYKGRTPAEDDMKLKLEASRILEEQLDRKFSRHPRA